MDDVRRPLRSATVKWRVLDEEGVLVDLDSATYFTLNPVGLFIWDRCTGGFCREEIAEGLVKEFQVDLATARTDLDAFLGVLSERRLIDFVEAPAAAS